MEGEEAGLTVSLVLAAREETAAMAAGLEEVAGPEEGHTVPAETAETADMAQQEP